MDEVRRLVRECARQKIPVDQVVGELLEHYDSRDVLLSLVRLEDERFSKETTFRNLFRPYVRHNGTILHTYGGPALCELKLTFEMKEDYGQPARDVHG